MVPSYTDQCALKLHPSRCAQTDEMNIGVLAAISALETQLAPGMPGDEGDLRQQELVQLESKINVLIQMFAGFWAQQCQLPSPVPMEISARGLRIAESALSWPDEVRAIELYLHPALPQPMKLNILACRPDPDRAGHILLDFMLSEDLENALARHVFRRHRRDVARMRKASNLHVNRE